jgi:uncharacterized protein (TIGR02147 family)
VKKTQQSISVFDYMDYRAFLRDYYQEQKRKRPAFSYRFFALQAGINSTGLYKDVVDGRKKLSQHQIRNFSKAMHLTPPEAEYLENMVHFTEARTVEQRQPFFDRMLVLSPTRARPLDETEHEYYAFWYYSAIRSLISFFEIANNYEEVARMLSPSITSQQVVDALAVLEKLGLIRKNRNGRYKQTSAHIMSGMRKDKDNPITRQLFKLQKEFVSLGQEAYDRHPVEALDMSTLTLSISETTFAELKKQISDLRKKILRLSEMDKKAARVIQLNIQLFPLTVIPTDDQELK